MHLPLLPKRPATTAFARLTLMRAAALVLLMPRLAAAAEAEPADSWSLGLGAGSMQKPYAGMDRENRVLPMLSYENRWLRVAGLGAEVKLQRLGLGLGLGDKQHLDFRLVARYDGSGFEADDAPILNGMAERKGGFWAGARAIWRTGFAQLNAEWTADASGHSQGQRLSLGVEKNFRVGPQLMLTPRLGAAWLDRKSVDYYFGVRDGEVQPGRAAYGGRAGVNTELGLRGAYLLDRHHSLFVDVGVTRLSRAIRDSPLVDRSTENRVFMGYLYRF